MWHDAHPTNEIVEVLTIDGIPLGYARYIPTSPRCFEWLSEPPAKPADYLDNIDIELRTVASYN